MNFQIRFTYMIFADGLCDLQKIQVSAWYHFQDKLSEILNLICTGHSQSESLLFEFSGIYKFLLIKFIKDIYIFVKAFQLTPSSVQQNEFYTKS